MQWLNSYCLLCKRDTFKSLSSLMYSLIFPVYHVINTINNSVVLFRKNVETKLHVQITFKLGSDYQISV